MSVISDLRSYFMIDREKREILLRMDLQWKDTFSIEVREFTMFFGKIS